MDWNWGLFLKTILFSAIVLCTIVGNLMVLTAIFLNRTLRSPAHAFIGNLALADLLVGILVLPCNATTQITGKWYFGEIYCVGWACVHLFLCSASILSICAICLDRYIGVSEPFRHFQLMRARVVRSLIAGVWVTAFCLGVIPVFIWPEEQDGGLQTCKFNSDFGLVLVVTVGIFYIPLSVMLILYWKIYRAASKHAVVIRQGQKRFKQSTNTPSNDGINVGGSASQSPSMEDGAGPASASCSSTDNLQAVNMSRQTKAAKKLTVVVGAFILCYFPFFTVFLITGIQNFQEQEVSISTDLFDVFGWIRYFNSCLNPVIYAATLPAFRKAFKRIISCRYRMR